MAATGRMRSAIGLPAVDTSLHPDRTVPPPCRPSWTAPLSSVRSPKDTNLTVPELVAAAISLAPAVRAARDDAERLRQTPPALAEAITKAGIYQMYLPRSMGGPETPPLTAFRVV